jgi:magnesium chelatase family protein
MLASAFSSAVLGIDGYVVCVETDSSPGVPAFAIIGLPDRALNESRERVRAAIINSGFGFPPGRLLVNLAPADIRKEGPGFDLAIGLALLATDEQIDAGSLRDYLALGELALDGSLRCVPGLLAMMIAAKNAGFTKVIVPLANADEAALIAGLEIYAVPTFADAVAVVLGYGAKFRRSASRGPAPSRAVSPSNGDFGDVRGQRIAKRALEIAAAGGHNAVLVGPPGCGKTMLARRVPSILPPMSADESLAVTKIYSAAGALGTTPHIVTIRPFRAPHHTISHIALVGGGAHPKPGEISLAQHGVLLDELAEFSRNALEVMRQPLEEGSITIARAAGTVTYPARFMLVASMNPCPCGFRGSRANDCRCDDAVVAKYVAKLSGPLLDRIDLHVTVARVSFEELISAECIEPSQAIQRRVEAARARQRQRLNSYGIACNAEIAAADMRSLCALDGGSMELLQVAMARGSVSARAFDRIARVARTIADLDNAANISRAHVAEALLYRSIDRAIGARP